MTPRGVVDSGRQETSFQPPMTCLARSRTLSAMAMQASQASLSGCASGMHQRWNAPEVCPRGSLPAIYPDTIPTAELGAPHDSEQLKRAVSASPLEPIHERDSGQPTGGHVSKRVVLARQQNAQPWSREAQNQSRLKVESRPDVNGFTDPSCVCSSLP